MIAMKSDRTLRTAVLSADKTKRYALEQRLNQDLFAAQRGRVMFLMLNPSQADAQTDDLTFTKCVGFAQRWGFQDLAIGNVFPIRETNPKKVFLPYTQPPCSLDDPEAQYHLERMAASSRMIVVGWGDYEAAGHPSTAILCRLFDLAPTTPIMCLGRTQSGFPRHPSRLGYDTALEPFQWYRRVRVEVWKGPPWRNATPKKTPREDGEGLHAVASIPVPYWIKLGSQELATVIGVHIRGVVTPTYVQAGTFLHKVFPAPVEAGQEPHLLGRASTFADAGNELVVHPDWHRDDLVGFPKPLPWCPYPTRALDGTEEPTT